MSLDNGDPCLSDQPIESNLDGKKKSKILYERDFLLSLSELDICKNLPGGFDESILSEFEDNSQERQRTSGTFPLHGFRRNEYGSSPPTRGDTSSYSRGIHGRWDNRSSVRGDKDGDSQSDRDSDAGKRYTNPSRRGWQAPEHDGLLGSGGFPRPSGYVPGVSTGKLRPSDNYQLNRSTEPYHPPRPYKALPHSRRETNDSYNDETFGSSESTSEDRVEEERKRRVSFELMRKEQQKAFQERQKSNLDKHKADFDFSMLLEDSRDDKKQLNKDNELDEKASKASDIDSAKPSLSSQVSGPRPLVPPGFATTIQDRKSHSAEVKTSAHDNDSFHDGENSVLNGMCDGQEDKCTAEQVGSITREYLSTELHDLEKAKGEVNPLPTFDESNQTLSRKNLLGTCNLSETSESSDIGQTIEFDSHLAEGTETTLTSQLDHPTTILEKLFGSALSLDGVSSPNIKQQGVKGGEVWSSPPKSSSKFAHWFVEEEKELMEPTSSGRPTDLLSLIGMGEKCESLVSDVQTSDQQWPNGLLAGSQPTDDNVASAAVGGPESSFTGNKFGPVPAVLTCEDLENSILSGVSEGRSNLRRPLEAWDVNDQKTEQPRADVDNFASQHLLSLLTKGTSHNDVALFPTSDANFPGKVDSLERERLSNLPSDSKETAGDNLSDHGRPLTLETLFGTAFMKELQSVGAPLSAQRGSAASARGEVVERHGSSHLVIDEALLASRDSEAVLRRNEHENDSLALKRSQQTNLERTEERIFSFDDLRADVDMLQLQPEVGPKVAKLDKPAEIPLPEEDSLISHNDPLHLQQFRPGGHPEKADLSSKDAPFDIAEKLAVLNGIFKEERYARDQAPHHFHQFPFNKREPDIPIPNLQVQASSPPLHPHRLNHVGMMFNSLDPHPVHSNHPMKLADNILHDPRPNYQFPANIIRPQMHNLSGGFTGFDPPNHQHHHHHHMLQQMHLPGSFPPPHQLQGFPGGPQMTHLNNQVSGLIQELNPMQGFPFGQRQPNSGVPPPASEVGIGNNHPESFQRLIELERRANAKQISPFSAAAGHSQGMYGHDLDMSFRYR